MKNFFGLFSVLIFSSGVWFYLEGDNKEVLEIKKDEHNFSASPIVEIKHIQKSSNQKQSPAIQFISKPVKPLPDFDLEYKFQYDEKTQLLNIRRMELNNVDGLKILLSDSNPEIRTAAIGRYKELESEYELEENITRNDKQSGRFLPEILEQLEGENDSFVQDKAFDYIWEYAGKNDGSVKNTITNLLERDNLSVNTLNRISELNIDRYDMSFDKVKTIIQESPSFSQLTEADIQHINTTLKSLNNQ